MRRKLETDLALLKKFGTDSNLQVGDLEGDEMVYREMVNRYGIYFKGSMVPAIQKRLQNFDLEAELNFYEIIATGTGQRKARALKRLKVVNAF